MSENAPSLGGGDRNAEYASAGILGHGPVMVPGNAPRPDVADQRILSMPQVLADLSGALGISANTVQLEHARLVTPAEAARLTAGPTSVQLTALPPPPDTRQTTTKKAKLVN